MFKKILLTITTLISLSNHSASAQITPDQSLLNNSVVNSDGSIILINGGTQSGTNLFHSFQEFSVWSGQTAIFNNSPNILNIFSRVTGSSISEINGVLSANGTANLFLMNPNGITFGENATIAIGGSFLGTTANRIVFADGFEYRAKSRSTLILTLAYPISVGLSDPREIIVNGIGHQLIRPVESPQGNVLGTPVLGVGESPTGLRTNPNQTIALIGGEISIDGGILTAFSGQIELASVEQGIVQFAQGEKGFNFNYSGVEQFSDLVLDNQALLDASGISFGQINLQGRKISIEDGATIMLTNLGSDNSGSIEITATESVNLTGISDFSEFSLEDVGGSFAVRGIFSQSFAEGRGADILISAPDLVVQNFSTINTLSFAAGESGSIGVKTQNLLIDGDNPLSFFLPNSIGSVSSGSGGTGKILVTGEKISLLNGGLLISQNIGRGEGRPVRISADLIEISGAVPLEPSATQFVPSSVGSTTVFSETSSDVFISSDQLRLDSGGGLFANTNASGNAGDLVIKANSIEINGGVPSPIEEFSLPSQISSSADQPSPIFRELFALPSIPSGNAGSVELKTKNLTISDGALVSVLNEGTGNAGSIKINAENIHLDGGNISATTVSGQGGNINLEAQDLSLINNSTISATADGVGNGGNILINSDSLLLQGSTIKADALEGNGGNILINTEVFLVSSHSEITATSELGVDGTVEINTPERNLESIIKPVRATIIDVNLNLLQLCVNEKGEEALVLVKSEGLPELPLAEKATEYHDPELPQFIEVSKYLSPEEREFYQERLSGNAIIQTEDGEIKYVNLCLRDLMAEQEKLRFEEKQKSQNNR